MVMPMLLEHSKVIKIFFKIIVNSNIFCLVKRMLKSFSIGTF